MKILFSFILLFLFLFFILCLTRYYKLHSKLIYYLNINILYIIYIIILSINSLDGVTVQENEQMSGDGTTIYWDKVRGGWKFNRPLI